MPNIIQSHSYLQIKRQRDYLLPSKYGLGTYVIFQVKSSWNFKKFLFKLTVWRAMLKIILIMKDPQSFRFSSTESLCFISSDFTLIHNVLANAVFNQTKYVTWFGDRVLESKINVLCLRVSWSCLFNMISLNSLKLFFYHCLNIILVLEERNYVLNLECI